MSEDDDPVEAFVEDTVDGEDDDASVPETRDMEAELRDRTGVSTSPDAEDLEVDSDVATAFWVAVLYVNVGILLLVVGPIVYVELGRGLVSVALVGGGAALLFRAYLVYREFRAEREGNEQETADEAPAGDDPDDEA